MKTEEELNAKILKITLTIQEKYPELSEFLGEMTVTIPDIKSPEIDNKKLSLYYDSLKSLLENYISQHPSESAK